MNTDIENTPPSEEDRFFWRQSADYATEICRAIQEQVQQASPATRALDLLKNRIGGALNSLWVLRTHAPHDFGFDGMMILRGVYDAHLQALYILERTEEADARSTLFLDYQWVEKRQKKDLLDSNPTLFARTLRDSPKREAAEPAMDAEFDRVKPYYVGPKGKLRSNWYPGSLRDVARSVGLESEYEILQKQLSGAIHSSPSTLLSGPWGRGENILLMAWRLYFRVLGRVAEHHGVTLEAHPQELVRDSFRNLFEGPSDD